LRLLGPQRGRSRARLLTLGLVPAPLLFGIGGISQYGGAAVAVTLFALLPAAGVAWARMLVGAVVMLAVRRPWRRRWTARRAALVAAFGVCLAAMNVSFYLAADRLPLGTAVAIEFSGPVVVAALGTRRWRDGAALALALGGVLLLADVSWEGSPAGVGFSLGAAAMWGLYIVLAARIAEPADTADTADRADTAGADTIAGRSQPTEPDGVDGLAAALAVGALVFAPVLAPMTARAWTDPGLGLACVAVGLLSTTIPYGLDQVVLRRVSQSAFALLQSMLPATAAVIGAVALRQFPSVAEAVGIGLVVAAVAVRSPDARR
jgi:inner membrane transporter RhtA